jgi:hypothetical protein
MFVSNQNQPQLIGIPNTNTSMMGVSSMTSSSIPQQQHQHQQQYGNTTTTTANNNNGLDIATFYIVQKCWYSGPKIPVTVDYLRLLPSIAQAEQVAYQSAHTYASVSSSGASFKNSGVVRTIQIPVHHQHNTNGPSAAATTTTNSTVASSYGFVANGLLFWIRRINVWVASGVPINTVVDSAHCILTNGIIGIPNSNSNNYRTSTIVLHNNNEQQQSQNQPCAFVGPAGYAWALQQSASGQIPIGSTCQWVPVGKPNFDNITGEWPDRHEWNTTSTTNTNTSAVVQQQQQQQSLLLSSVPEVSPVSTKRVSDHSRSDHYWFANNNTSGTGGAVTCSSSSDVSDLDDSYRGSYRNYNSTIKNSTDVAMDTEDNSDENDGSMFDNNNNNQMFISQPASKRRCYNHRDSLATTTTTTSTTTSTSTTAW